MKISKDSGFVIFENEQRVCIYDIRLSDFNGFPSIRDCLNTKQWATEEIINNAEQTASKDMASFDD